MGYATSNPPSKVTNALGSGKNIWIYSSTDDDATTNGASYYSNGVALGMKVGDMVYVWDSTTPKGSVCYVASVTSTAATTAFAAVA
jgi:hypothetical protein